jgi:mono/diheme cytochrome c family protein
VSHRPLVTLALAAALAQACDQRPPVPLSNRGLFLQYCARCHGADGTGGPVLPGQPTPRNFTDAAFQKDRTDDQLRGAILAGKPPGMPPFGPHLAPAQVDGLVGEVRKFGR